MGTLTDLTTPAATDDELRRRAAEGDQAALAEQLRRQAEPQEGRTGARVTNPEGPVAA